MADKPEKRQEKGNNGRKFNQKMKALSPKRHTALGTFRSGVSDFFYYCRLCSFAVLIDAINMRRIFPQSFLNWA